MSASLAQLLIPALVADADGRFTAARARFEEGLALGVGGFLLQGGNSDAVRALTKEAQQRARRPLLFGADMERGAGQQFIGATGLPPLAAIAWLDDVEALRRAARHTAREARTMGVNWSLGPVVDLDVEPRNPIVGTRAFGADPQRVARLATAWIEACQAEGVLACAKHFPGHGRTVHDSHLELPAVQATREELHATDLAPFKAAIAANVASMMTAHVAYPALDPSGLPATLSRELITWLLRQQLKYDGLLAADALDMRGLLDAVPDEGEGAVRAIAAGCDVLLAPQDVAAAAAALDRARGSGVLDPARAQMAERRRLKWAQWAAPPNDWRRPSASDALWGAQLADRVVHLVQGTLPALGARLPLLVLDDDAVAPSSPRGPAPAAGRGALPESLRAAGYPVELLDPTLGPESVAEHAGPV
ncbi:MAG TPA: glycoside hydrolase family 3 N-terminal domain-containing protein, partial [Gemmatirosa sp.]|nr:glycoside hydrolase family 3 N-terminal domain-containing protein [Gemmatirosa sp.]